MSIGNNFCFKCGEALASGAQFCMKCGTKIPQSPLDGNAQAMPAAVPVQAMPTQAMSAAMPAQAMPTQAIPVQTAFTAAPAQMMASTVPSGQINPNAPVKVTEQYIWGLACAPFFGSLVVRATVSFILAAIHNGVNDAYWAAYNVVFPWTFMALCIILNIFFLTKDMEEIKKTGQDAASWMWLGLILVPVYIGVRESKTNKNYWPLLVNIVLIFLC